MLTALARPGESLNRSDREIIDLSALAWTMDHGLIWFPTTDGVFAGGGGLLFQDRGTAKGAQMPSL